MERRKSVVVIKERIEPGYLYQRRSSRFDTTVYMGYTATLGLTKPLIDALCFRAR